MNIHHTDAHMRRRQAFTLVELLVALALIIFIMSILSQAFATATKTFRDLKSAGDLAERLRMVTARIHRDLAADHFGTGVQTVRLSDPGFWLNASNGGISGYPPGPYMGGGFFNIYQGQIPTSNTVPQPTDYFIEGTQTNSGVASTMTTSHAMHFTVKLKGSDLGDIFSTSAAANNWAPRVDSIQFTGTLDSRFLDPRIPPSSNGTGPAFPQTVPSLYNYNWAEVAYFLRPSIDPISGNQDSANGTNLYNLYVRRRLAVQDNAHVQLDPAMPAQAPPAGWVNSPNDYPEISCLYDPPTSTTMYFNSPIDLSVPQRRFGNPANLMAQDTPPSPAPNAYGPLYPTLGTTGQLGSADLLLTDVVSFEIRMLFADPNAQPGTAGQPYIPNPTQPFMTLWDLQAATNAFTKGSQVPAGVLVFDTWSQRDDSASFGPSGNYSTWNTAGATNIPLFNYTTNNGPIILAIQVTIRIWDRKSQLTRQVSVVQAM